MPEEITEKNMARYCFYCGRELGDHEKCDCRGQAGWTASRAEASETAGPKAADGPDRKDQGPPPPPKPPGGNWQHRGQAHTPRDKKKKTTQARYGTYRRSPADRARQMASFFSFFASPADAMARDLSAHWTASHSIWLAVTLALSGIHYSRLNRSLSQWLAGEKTASTMGQTLLAWLVGLAFVALILLLFTLTLWLIARFLYRQGGLPFLHTLAAGRSAWKYLSLFLILALPSLFSGGAVYGLVLALSGLVFAAIIHGRQVASLTCLDENRAWQLSYLSLIIFAGILSSVTSLVQALGAIR